MDFYSRELFACSKVESSKVLKLSDVLEMENVSLVRRLSACKNPKKRSIFGRGCSLALATCKWRETIGQGTGPWRRSKSPGWLPGHRASEEEQESWLAAGDLDAGLGLGSEARRSGHRASEVEQWSRMGFNRE